MHRADHGPRHASACCLRQHAPQQRQERLGALAAETLLGREFSGKEGFELFRLDQVAQDVERLRRLRQAGVMLDGVAQPGAADIVVDVGGFDGERAGIGGLERIAASRRSRPKRVERGEEMTTIAYGHLAQQRLVRLSRIGAVLDLGENLEQDPPARLDARRLAIEGGLHGGEIFEADAGQRRRHDETDPRIDRPVSAPTGPRPRLRRAAGRSLVSACHARHEGKAI